MSPMGFSLKFTEKIALSPRLKVLFSEKLLCAAVFIPKVCFLKLKHYIKHGNSYCSTEVRPLLLLEGSTETQGHETVFSCSL